MRLLLVLLALVAAACSSSPTSPLDEPDIDDMADAVRIAEGTFSGANGYSVRGTAALYRRTDGSHVVRIEGLDSDNGPDLKMYLVRRTTGDIGEGGLNLGDLKSTQGNQNYDVPAATDVTAYAGVSVWCRRFSVGFGTAPLADV